MSETTPIPTPPDTDSLVSVTEQQLQPMAQAIESTFTELSRSLTEELARASSDGRQSISDLADGIIDDLARIAAQELVRKPLENVLSGAAEEGSSRLFRSLMKRNGRHG